MIDAAPDGAGEIRVALRPDAGLPIGRQVARDEGAERVGVEDEPARHREAVAALARRRLGAAVADRAMGDGVEDVFAVGDHRGVGRRHDRRARHRRIVPVPGRADPRVGHAAQRQDHGHDDSEPLEESLHAGKKLTRPWCCYAWARRNGGDVDRRLVQIVALTGLVALAPTMTAHADPYGDAATAAERRARGAARRGGARPDHARPRPGAARVARRRRRSGRLPRLRRSRVPAAGAGARRGLRAARIGVRERRRLLQRDGPRSAARPGPGDRPRAADRRAARRLGSVEPRHRRPVLDADRVRRPAQLPAQHPGRAAARRPAVEPAAVGGDTPHRPRRRCACRPRRRRSSPTRGPPPRPTSTATTCGRITCSRATAGACSGRSCA